MIKHHSHRTCMQLLSSVKHMNEVNCPDSYYIKIIARYLAIQSCVYI